MPTCTALFLHTKAPCTAPATSANGLFCYQHAREVQLLYNSYKRSSAAYDALEAAPPPKQFPKKNYATTDWSSYSSLQDLDVCRKYLESKYKHLHRCLVGRELHHSHFYSDTSDFGHQSYLEHLRTQRALVDGALKRLNLRAMQVGHKEEKWTKWVRALAAKEDEISEAKRKEIKAEAAKYQEELAEMEALEREEWERTREEREKREVWDPIEEVIKGQRVGYLAVVRLLLQRAAKGVEEEEEALKRARELQKVIDGIEGAVESNLKVDKLLEEKRKVLEERRTSPPMVIRPIRMDLEEGAMLIDPETKMDMSDLEDDMLKSVMESLNELFKLERGASTYDLEEREQALDILKEKSRGVREFLFLRLIAKNPALLDVTLKKESIEEFLDDDLAVRNSDLRDLALGLAKPNLIMVRHAFSDYWFAQNEEKVDKNTKQHKERLKICGKWIHNFPDQATLPRKGWFLFALLSGISLNKARELCNSWEELRELDLLQSQNYFAGLDNEGWGAEHDDFMFSTFRRMGYHHVDHRLPLPAKEHRNQKDEHVIVSRMSFHGIMGRNDPATRRFISLVKSAPAIFNIHAIDIQLNKVITTPPKNQQWIMRVRHPKVSKSRDPDDPKNYTVTIPFDEKFRQQMRKHREWKPNFNDYIEIFVWDRGCGCTSPSYVFMNKFMMFLQKANKFSDYMAVIEPALQVYRKCTLEEEGKGAPRLKHIKKVEDEIKELRRNKTEDQLRIGSEADYYNSADAQIDYEFAPYDNDQYWKDNDPNFQLSGVIPNLIMYWKLYHEEKDAEANKYLKRVPKKYQTPTYKTSEVERMHILAEKGDHIDDFWASVDEEIEEVLDWSEETADVCLENDAARLPPRNVLVASNMIQLLSGLDDEMALDCDIDMAGMTHLRNELFRNVHHPHKRPGHATPAIYAQFEAWLKEKDLDLMKLGDKYALLEGTVGNLPTGWYRAIMMEIARLWDEGSIEPADQSHAYPTYAASAPGYKGLKMYIDYRWAERWGYIMSRPDYANPLPEDPLWLKHQFEEVSATQPDTARYSLIMLKSEDTYWSLDLLSPESENTVFADPLGRRWRWKKTPKDFAGYESDVAEIFRNFMKEAEIARNTRVYVDRVLCWGKDEKEAREVTHKVAVLMNKPKKGKFSVDWAKVRIMRTREQMREMGDRWWMF
ncbi:hypothetical protein BJ508DRAFT_377631 [Ascobolus immersus RN42]|uniref:Uncharacterized protein n=1 Tax=Ascobolus immersus RN42 TaxID=1160509 RepID=A0A3N4I5N0_ASCIM|nr:hypothetical protein BJ508DRAFT_377631 [Ascobolus immersus RN42]